MYVCIYACVNVPIVCGESMRVLMQAERETPHTQHEDNQEECVISDVHTYTREEGREDKYSE
jgi:hypothetical protein